MRQFLLRLAIKSLERMCQYGESEEPMLGLWARDSTSIPSLANVAHR
uniref:Uncharacterized protein n=2 Tax=unclassified bacterial viruses TaxID=12333 RepID=A0AAU8KTS1_9VIRU